MNPALRHEPTQWKISLYDYFAGYNVSPWEALTEAVASWNFLSYEFHRKILSFHNYLIIRSFTTGTFPIEILKP